jgi:hypothetical protein
MLLLFWQATHSPIAQMQKQINALTALYCLDHPGVAACKEP